MSGPLGSSQLMYSTGAGNFYEHLIERSCRFDNGDSSRLYREENTPAYNSFTYFVTAYGDNGRPISSSTFGSFFESP